MNGSIAPAEIFTLSRRSAHIPLRVRAQRELNALLNLARALERGDLGDVAAWDDTLDLAAATDEVLAEAMAPIVSPTARSKVLSSVLIDLARSGWKVSVEDRQVYVAAPEWSFDAKGMSPEAVQAEKNRARATMAGRVQEELESENSRRFLQRMESPRSTEAGVRSVLSLIADGPALADSLRKAGAHAISPVLQRADAEAGRDPETGLAYVDIFRYFRLFWSFPTSAPPGRSLSYLIRDAGQPGSPVCALVCVASPVPRLSVRDSALGWTAAWLEAVVTALDFPPDAPEPHLRAVVEAYRATSDLGAHGASIVEDVAALLGFPAARDPGSLTSGLRSLPPSQRAQRADGARKRILADLRQELSRALEAISFDRFGFTLEEALEYPSKMRKRLEPQKEAAYATWRESQTLTAAGGAPSGRLDKGALATGKRIRDAAREPLFVKKRVTQASDILRAWEEISPRPGERVAERLREIVLGASEPARPCLSGGARVLRGARFALLQRQNRVVASQVLDVCVCGAVPPYGPLLGGKLAALAALSREVAADYHERYAHRPSEITSQMAGRAFERPADLLALTTTSFFGVGSSQYERLSAPTSDGSVVRWRPVGRTRGNGTLHFSRRTSELIDDLLCIETGQRLITSRFGEGPSERLRKIRDGLERLGLDADEILRHGMPRLVYVAELSPGATRPGCRGNARPWRKIGPTMKDLVSHWASRWLEGRLRGRPALIDDVERFSRVEALLSLKLPRRRGGAR